MFSPIVSAPLTLWSPSSPSGVSASYWAMRLAVRCSNAVRSSSVYQSRSDPSPSKRLPWSSNPCPISWPMTAPMPP